MKLESIRIIDIESFVPAASIDRLYWDMPYHLVPSGKTGIEAFFGVLGSSELLRHRWAPQVSPPPPPAPTSAVNPSVSGLLVAMPSWASPTGANSGHEVAEPPGDEPAVNSKGCSLERSSAAVAGPARTTTGSSFLPWWVGTWCSSPVPRGILHVRDDPAGRAEPGAFFQ